MSRPCASVPNGNSQLGGSSAFIRLASITGWGRASQGARMAIVRAMPTRPPPTHVLVPHFMVCSAVTDARIDHDIGHIEQGADQEKEQNDQQDEALDPRDVALEHRITQERAD